MSIKMSPEPRSGGKLLLIPAAGPLIRGTELHPVLDKQMGEDCGDPRRQQGDQLPD